MSQTPHSSVAPTSKVTLLRQRVAAAKRLGAQIRSEWLGGETGGACEIAGRRWIFLDLSLSIEEQLEQVEDALRQWDPPAATSPQPAGASAPESDAAAAARSDAGAGPAGLGRRGVR